MLESVQAAPSIGRWARAMLCLTLLTTGQLAHAFQLEHAEPLFIDREYRFEMTALLDAPIADVERVLRNYTDYSTLDERILEATVLERPEEGIAILATTLRACFGPVCRTVRRVERVHEAPAHLLAITDPERSDMKFGRTELSLAAADGQTRVTYRTRLQPDFWIPALIARRIMLETLEDATIQLFQNVEKRARAENEALSGVESVH